MTKLAQINRYLEDHKESFESDLCQLLEIPSVSADSQYAAGIQQAAKWMFDQFQKLGLETEVIETSGHPIVYAESQPVAGAPTVLVYGHYDVQPPDPVDLWISPPFDPTIRDGKIYARGATDDKGQMMTHVKSAQAWIETSGELPVQLKFIIEGEEEVGSESIVPYIKNNKSRLACDCVVVSDMSQFGPGQPAITYGLRGIVYYQLLLTGPKQDLHSGTFGGAVTNPATAMSKMLSALVDGDGKIQVPGFYDDVVPLTDREREGFQSLSFNDSQFFRHLGVEGSTGESGFSPLERRWARPSFDVNGIWGGYQGEGAKTVLPAAAGAKFSFRLVPDQDPDKITEHLRGYIEEHCPAGVTCELEVNQGSPSIVVSLDSPYIEAAVRAIENGFGTPPVFIREGGSVPIVSTFAKELTPNTLLLGWGQNDDNTHSPNEKFNLSDFHRGIRTSAYLWAELAKIKME